MLPNVVAPLMVLLPVAFPIVLAAPAPVPKMLVVDAPVASVALPELESVVNAPVDAVVAPIGVLLTVPAAMVSASVTLASGRIPVTFVVRSMVPFAMLLLTIVLAAMSAPVIEASTIFLITHDRPPALAGDMASARCVRR